MSAISANTRKIALVGYNGVQSLDLVGPWEVFSMANTFGGARAYEPILASPGGGDIVSHSGLVLAGSVPQADLGPDVALAVARNLVLFMRRPGGQTQFSAGLNVQTAATPTLRKLIADLAADPTGDLGVPALAARAGMSERTFSRVFHKETGTTPAAFVELARVDRAKALLETSDWPLARVAERSGFTSLDALHRAFHKRVGATPGDYRER